MSAVQNGRWENTQTLTALSHSEDGEAEQGDGTMLGPSS